MRISILLIFLLSSTQANAATFTIQNNCPITIWPAAVPGGGRRLELGQTWTLSVSNGTSGRIWARTSCSFTRSGQGRCLTGDCDGLLQCQAHGAPPNTLVEYSLNQFNDLDYLDISLLDGFNVPIEISRSSGTRSSSCRAVRCVADINGQCPRELRAAGGCNNPCTVYNNQAYCCTNSTGHCGPTAFSMFFKERCRDAFSYPLDDSSSTFLCGGGNIYRVVFCP